LRAGVPDERNVAALFVVSVAHVHLQLIVGGLQLLLFCFELALLVHLDLLTVNFPVSHLATFWPYACPALPRAQDHFALWFCDVVVVVVIVIVAAAAIIAWAGATATATAATHGGFLFMCDQNKNKRVIKLKIAKTKLHATQPVERQQ
jgi:hypothetical protein